MAEIVNTFQRSNSSTLPQAPQPEGTYIRALNAIDQSREASGFGLTFEEALELVADFGGDIVGKSYIEERHQTLFFIAGAGSKLVLFDHKTNALTHVVTDTEFGCDWGFSTCEFMYGEFKKFNKCRELHVYFSSNCVYHVVNIDEMLNPVRKAAVADLEDPCGHFDLFKCICGPHISATPSNFNGSTLEAGSYACAIRLSDSDGNETNVFDVGQFAVASSEDNVGGQMGKSSIKFNISNLDPKYNKAIIYIIKTVAGLTTVEQVDARTYGDRGFTYEYYGQKGTPVAISTLTGKERAYLRGQDQIQKDGFMLFYSLRNEKNLNYQKYANQITVEYVEWEMSLEQAAKYHFPSLLRGEVYAFAIVWKFCDGTYSPAFHIPAGASAAIAESLGVRTSASSDGNYKPIELSDFDTADQHQRLRNPSAVKDRRNESDKLENQIEADAENIDTNFTNIEGAGDCHDNLYGCDEAGTALRADIRDVVDPLESNNELLAGYGLDKPDPDVNTTSNLKESALKLITDAVTNREYVTRKRPTLNYTGVNAGAPGTPPTTPDPEVVLSAVGSRGDNWVDGMGNPLTEEPPRIISTGAMGVYESTVPYPNDKDCDGQRFFPEGNVKHHRVPWSSEKPHYVSYTNGVENQYQPDNHPYAKTFVRPMGIKVSGIHIPTDAELPKPLCPHSPYKIVYVKRTAQNKSIYAKGWLSGVIRGSNYGVNYAYPRHAVNSQETVDRSIASGADGMSRKGSHNTSPIYTFHSPDTDADQSSIPVSRIKPELALQGSGWLYGLAEEGRKPQDQWNGTREDYVGARCANNLNHYTIAGGDAADILGITYAHAHEPTTQAAGIELPLCNTFREGAIYLQASANMAGDEVDQSFIGVVMDHFFPTKCNAPYVALIRELPDQYGSVEGLRYADLGVTARQNQGGEITGICGDTYIGPYSKKRTSYVSNKKGDVFNVPAKPGSPCRERSWCDMPDDKIFEYTGIDYYPTKLPKPGDIYDPKNYAGLHTVAGSCGANGRSKRISEVTLGGESESDFYWPHTLNALTHTIIECEVNPFLRETGVGDQTLEGKVHYHKLTQKGMVLDARAPVGQPVERGWLNRFRWSLEQPSVKQLTAKAWVRSGMTLGGPLLTLFNLQEMEGILGPVMTMFTSGAVNAIWVTMLNTLFTDKRLNELLRIGDCKTDSEGGDLDENIKGFENNYTVYNRDFTRVNDIYPYTAMPLPYNTCDCNFCGKENINNDSYYTNKQNPDSDIDAYKNVKINNYQNTPCHYGDLRRLFILNNQLMAHYTDGYAVWKINPLQMQSDIVLQQKGDGQLLSEPQLAFEGVQEGFAGTTHPNAGILTPSGYWFIDDKAQKIYRLGEGIDEVSAYDFHFFKNNMQFCTVKECYDEKSADGNHYSLGWDPRYNRLLVTKFDGQTCDSWTYSFRPGQQAGWVSLHSYIPQDYLWDRENLYSITGTQLWKHHKKGEYLNVYGKSVPFIVDFSAAAGQTFTPAYMEIDVLSEREGVKDLDETFTEIGIQNSNESTGLRPVEAISDNDGAAKSQQITHDTSKIQLKKQRRRWTSNNLHNLLNDCSTKPLTTTECCNPIPEWENGDCGQNAQDFRGRHIPDDHLIYRLKYEGDGKTRLYLRKVKTVTNG